MLKAHAWSAVILSEVEEPAFVCRHHRFCHSAAQRRSRVAEESASLSHSSALISTERAPTRRSGEICSSRPRHPERSRRLARRYSCESSQALTDHFREICDMVEVHLSYPHGLGIPKKLQFRAIANQCVKKWAWLLSRWSRLPDWPRCEGTLIFLNFHSRNGHLQPYVFS